MTFKGAALPLQENDVTLVAGYLGVEIAAVRAVMAVESNGKAFGADGRPIILNEPHIFYRQLGTGPKRDTAVRKGLAYRRWRTKPYPRTQAGRYQWLAEAMAIDAAAALKSCSWGSGQVMGFNYEVAGFKDVFAFVEAMKHSEGAQLMVMARFIVGNRLQRHLRNRDWAKFARGYNGAGYKQNRYDSKLASAYARRPKSEKIVPPVPSEQELSHLLGHTAAPSPKLPPPPPTQPIPDHVPTKPPSRGGFFDALIRFLRRLFQ